MSTPTPGLPANWVHDVGYTNEQLHAGLLQRLLTRASTAACHDLLAALWMRATGRALSAGSISQPEVTREAPLQGRRVRLDLLISFKVGQLGYRLGIELKVDSPPERAQLRGERDGLASSYPTDQRALVLLCLGTAQVCHCALPPETVRWSLSDLLQWKSLFLDALPGDPFIAGWLESLELEASYRSQIFSVPLAHQRSYRARSYLSYWLGALSGVLDRPPIAGLSPWHPKLEANGPISTAEGSWRHKKQGLVTAWVYFEIHWGVLYFKATASEAEKSVDPRPYTQAITDALLTQLAACSPPIVMQKTRFRSGEYSALLRLPLDFAAGPDSIRELMVRIGQVWQPLPAQHNFIPEIPANQVALPAPPASAGS